MWQEIVTGLREFQCMVPDLPGHGGSAAVPWLSMRGTVDALAETIQRHVPEGCAHVVGLSLGGYLALSLARQHPTRVGRVVISGVSVLPFPRPGLMRALGLLTAPLLKREFFIRAQAKALRVPAAKLPEYYAAAKAMSSKAFLRIGDELMEYRPEVFAGAQAPTLVLAGEAEHQLVRNSVPAILRALPNSEARLAPAMGHGWIGEAPELFMRTARAWLLEERLPADLVEPPNQT
jgi:pimeloyl-ACP methyl ester carboxylesterase